ncbi:hypothetical protein AGABI1DRAFT_134983 [Agaricus bisporus var. burnettii JB137-S8]|uniref:Uncharacterized protein n=1 Tax=Agaricus bisporus var. burnettii (strain JB137-S8 / ATCC MYA-4627 / FGSC 10392) TaxID=597362 RepID=K5WDM6_AGABU|nr:uncharacterized protein AGABI1DRAFT_134983 [Agaricus bisporus var. burnettii JB137-S8]EKM73351.1 hypothetical protein AGABI1DRAFT_134983 [Agaricus bisporus var. burnettii JB137-S8]
MAPTCLSYSRTDHNYLLYRFTHTRITSSSHQQNNGGHSNRLWAPDSVNEDSASTALMSWAVVSSAPTVVWFIE